MIQQTATLHGRVDWKAAILAGLIAGVVFLMIEMILVAVTSGSPWGPPRMMAAMVMGEGVLPPPATFDVMIMMVAMVVHVILSILLAVVFAWVLSRWRLSAGAAVALGGAFGLLVYLVNFYPVAAILFPWFAMARNWISIISHVAFGAVLAWAYLALARRERGVPHPHA
ncbi:MAG: putative membrane protein YagU involved in acid resistance [Afipia broomeae]|jgi:uncharacterized membrane protein YagU involved in acid resistance